MDFSSEPPHSELLHVQAHEPFNAEPPVSSLVEFNITPEELVFCRNHGPVRIFDEDSYTFQIHNGEQSTTLTLGNLKALPRTNIVAALQCAGNRRNEMGKIKPVNGVGWNDGVVANCRWTGARLRDVLAHVGVSSTSTNSQHVCFASYATLCQDDHYYGSSIPLNKAFSLTDDVLLAYEMNGEPLPSERGGPLRVVVPGVLGARWVKWLDTIIISSAESPNFYQQRDYKVLPPTVENKQAAIPLWSKYPAMTALPLNSVVATAIHDDKDGSLYVKGYATPSDFNVAGVDVSVDDGETWAPAKITYQEGRWSWALWEANLNVHGSMEHRVVYSRARDTQGNLQKRVCDWNMRGVAYSAWGWKEW
ncbi:molybdopterin binding oxidoreductase [Cylindrobasidium torrendii FP15055 ss-10]|uniref:Molybdopterin binding oxidoreductase n=1 Tax=Cylindrobasidium torrendii FP15055 ss-10 TaxID=1314674 RepID=A0A0D7BED6_9AGAR|nr:molybdopterin binding oxidoreductase [Cylindrobasidium torrendii FP15055 ss-10]